MNNYSFEDLTIGLSCEFFKRITIDDVKVFSKLSGDLNPLHMNKEFAIKHGFRNQVVFGMLTASLFSTLGGMYIPGEKCIIQGVEIMFSKPVYVNDEITVKGRVVELFQSVGQAVIKVEMFNQNNERVLRGKLKAGVLSD